MEPRGEVAAGEVSGGKGPEGEESDGRDRSADALYSQAVQVAAAQSLLPAALRAALRSGAPLAAQLRQPPAGESAGPSSQRVAGGLRGRVLSIRPGLPHGRARLNLIATLRAAAPWQQLRRHHSPAPGETRLRVWPDDLRVNLHARRSPSTTVFVVDASGSSALHRMAEAKGAVELLLADCYVRRDEVAVIAFRLDQAEVLLPPTRSLLRAKRRLAALPGGGGTPLASALAQTATLVAGLCRKGHAVQVIVLSDGKANVDRQGQPGRQGAMADAHATARILGTLAWGKARLAWVDTSPRPSQEAQALAASMAAQYTTLPHADAAGIHTLARQLAHPAQPRAPTTRS